MLPVQNTVHMRVRQFNEAASERTGPDSAWPPSLASDLAETAALVQHNFVLPLVYAVSVIFYLICAAVTSVVSFATTVWVAVKCIFSFITPLLRVVWVSHWLFACRMVDVIVTCLLPTENCECCC